jgi:hypothetical protein
MRRKGEFRTEDFTVTHFVDDNGLETLVLEAWGRVATLLRPSTTLTIPTPPEPRWKDFRQEKIGALTAAYLRDKKFNPKGATTEDLKRHRGDLHAPRWMEAVRRSVWLRLRQEKFSLPEIGTFFGRTTCTIVRGVRTAEKHRAGASNVVTRESLAEQTAEVLAWVAAPLPQELSSGIEALKRRLQEDREASGARQAV